jgi:hypothetical protein
MNSCNKSNIIASAIGLTSLLLCYSAQLPVGDDAGYTTIESALKSAQPGDTIVVQPLADNRPYKKVALYITKSNITIKAATPDKRIPLSGEGFDYSGRGSIPRAIVQFNRGADGCTLEGFELSGASNGSHNGAGVRINQANGVTIVNCEIHGNDMGIMSNGDGTANAGADQRIERCLIHHNGNFKHPGYNHNLYIGGESVSLTGCEVHSSLTGHNVKSRAHRTVVHACYIHDSSNREVDLVDHEGDTSRADSDAVIINCVIVKDKKCRGNRGVIHFGEDIGGEHNGTLHLVGNTIVTPYISPVVYLSANQGDARIYNNIICDGGTGQRNQVLVQHSKKVAAPKPVFVAGNWLSFGYPESTAGKGAVPPFADPANGDYRLKDGSRPLISKPVELPRELLDIIGSKCLQYRHPPGVE